jgi:hypothetical protein
LKNPIGYASNSETAKQKVNYLVTNIRPRLEGSEINEFDLAEQKYKEALEKFNSGATPTCPRCQSRMVMRSGRYGQFWGCSRFPYCKGTRNH